MRPIATLSVVGALLALTTSATSQLPGLLPAGPGAPVPTPAPQWALDAYQVSAGTVQDLVMPTNREAFRFQVVLGQQVVTIDLAPNDIRTEDFQLLVDDGVSITRLPTPESVTWRGRVLGANDSVVAASIYGQQLDMTVSLGTGEPLWGVQSLRAIDGTRPVAQHLVYSSANSTAQNTSCGTDHTGWKASPPTPGTEMRKVAEIALDADLEYYQRNGSNTTQTQNAVTTVMNGVDAIYQRDTDIEYEITTILVRTTRTYTSSNMGTLLNQFRSRWNQSHGNIRRDVAHLFTGKGSFSGTVGIAFLGVVCNIANAYGVDKAFAGSATNVGLVCHELGHNWNAPHCDGANPCNIMCAGLGGCNRNLSSFGNVSINTIVNFKNSRSCLSDPAPSQPPSITSVAPTSMQVYPPSQIIVRGINMGGVDRVDIGSVTINNPFVVSDTEVRVTAPIPSNIGPNFVRAFNTVGGSNPLPVSFTPTSPPLHGAPGISIGGQLINFPIAGDPNDNYFLLASFNDTSSIQLFGFTILTGNAIVLLSGSLNNVGFSQPNFQVPNLSLGGLQMRTQAVLLQDTNGTLNYVTNIIPTTFF